jgi:hypothetical protein
LLDSRVAVCCGNQVRGVAHVVFVQEMVACVADAPLLAHVPSAAGRVVDVDLVVVEEAESLHATGELLVGAFLGTAAVHFLLIIEGGVAGIVIVGSIVRDLPIVNPDRIRLARDVHIVKTIIGNGIIIKPWTVAALPLSTTYHTEFSSASAGAGY